MTPHNLKIYALIKAKEAELEGMKAENAYRQHSDLSIAYTESSFTEIANEIEALSSMIEYEDRLVVKSV